GATGVSQGTLLVNASITSNVTVSSGATLGGTGTVNSASTVAVNSGGFLAPGTSPGTFNVGNTTLAGGSTFSVEIGGTTAGLNPNGYDQLNVTGTVTITGATLSAVQFNSFVPSNAVQQTFRIIQNDSTDPVTGTFVGLAEGA